MKGDFSRRTFDKADHYSAVLIEQGRMLTDADLEEEHRILTYRIEREAADLIGGCGAPYHDDGFLISADGAGGLTIGEGRYYVDGILVANDADVDYIAQPDRRDVPAPTLQTPGLYRAVLDVWRRLITAIDDPAIREVALGGPTTSVREQVVWQVRLDQPEQATCLSELPDFGKTTGGMAARTNPVVTPDDPCLVPTTAGFKGLENQFYRVEIHGDGAPHDVADTGDAIAIVGLPAARNQVIVGETGWTAGEAIEIYRSGADRDPLQADLFLLVKAETVDGQTTLTLNRERQTYGDGDDPKIRRVSTTFVWSRDNGSVVTAIDGIAGADITVHDLGPDDVRGFRVGHWVEIIDDGRELEGHPGVLGWVQEVLVEPRIVRLTAPVAAPWFNNARRPKLRRWDGAGAVRLHDLPDGAGWIDLEDGIQIRFSDIEGEDHFRTGDYWHFPARAITAEPQSGNADPEAGEIGWPRDAADEPTLLDAMGIEHRYCPLALIAVAAADDDDNDDDVEVTFTDCRKLFPPVTELTTLHYVGGDGQEGVPNPNDPGSRSVALDAPLQVRVANGEHPAIGAQVRFAITQGNGRLQNQNVKTSDLTTDGAGLASCVWQLDGTNQHQQVDAQLLNAAGSVITNQIVRFHATLSRASEVSYDPAACPDLAAAGAITVQQAIDALCQRQSGGGCCCVVVGPGGEFEQLNEAVATLLEQGESDLCICLLPGLYDLPGWSVVNDDPGRRVNLSIKGCGPGTLIDLRDNGLIRGLWSFVLREVDFATRQQSWLEFDQVHEVRLETCRFTGIRNEGALVEIHDATNVYVGNSVFEAQSGGSLDEVIEVLRFDVVPELLDLFAPTDWRDFVGFSRDVAIRLDALPQNVREELWREILRRINRLHLDPLSMELENACRRLAFALVLETRDPFALTDHLIAIREEAIRSRPGIAFEIGWTMQGAPNPDLNGLPPSLRDPGLTRAGEIVIENNVIIGGLSLYGPGQDPWPTTEIQQTLERLERILDPPGNQTGPVLFNGHLGVAQLRNNHLTRVLAAQDVARALIELVQSGGEAMLETVFKSLHVTDNVIDGSPNVFVAEHVALTSNTFTLDAVPSLAFDDDVGQRVETVVVIGDTGTYTGNQGRGTAPLIQTALRDVTRARAQAANLELAIV